MTNEEFAKWLEAEKIRRKKNIRQVVLGTIGGMFAVVFIAFAFTFATDNNDMSMPEPTIPTYSKMNALLESLQFVEE